MKTTIVLLLCALMPITAVAGDTGYNVKYDGGWGNGFLVRWLSAHFFSLVSVARL